MKLDKHFAGIDDVESWFKIRPPKKGVKQWADGRSAKELAKYITANLPVVPKEIEDNLRDIVPADAIFDWDAEYVTKLPGDGEGRNHDAILFNKDIVVAIEAKADETLGELIEKELQEASVNKMYRISNLLSCIFGGGFKGYKKLRYQLLTASVGAILEAQKRGCNVAAFLVVVFKSNGKVAEEKLATNHKDIEEFLKATKAYEEKSLYVIPNNSNVKLYFKEIVI